jgi:hypothetical protein
MVLATRSNPMHFACARPAVLLTLLLAAAGAPAGEYTDVSSWTDAAIEQFLASAPVVHDEEIGSGVTNPHRLTLEQDGTRIRALFKYHDGYTSYVSGESVLVALNSADRYQYDVAAYRVDRMMGLDKIPPAVLRDVDGRPGMVQLWLEDTITEEKRVEQGLQPPDPAEFERQWEVMRVFDVLIYNDDRNAGNILYAKDWTLYPIDHTRAFRLHGGRPEVLRGAELTALPDMVPMLEAIDPDELKTSMKGLLHPMQVKALVKRRNQLVKQAEKSAGDEQG